MMQINKKRYSFWSLGFGVALLGALSVPNFWMPKDPRNLDRVHQIEKLRESYLFKERLRRGVSEEFAWPGLKSMQTSWTWLNVISSLHVSSGYEGDFSWLFSKLYTLLRHSNSAELGFIATLAPFYFVIGSDGAGSTLFVHELQKRAPQNYNVLFWSAFHGLDNLKIKPMAAYFYERAAQSPLAPDYLASLALRLKYGENVLDDSSLRQQILENQIDPMLKSRLERVRPDWFRKEF